MAVPRIGLDDDVQLIALNAVFHTVLFTKYVTVPQFKDYIESINKGFRASALLHTLANMADCRLVGLGHMPLRLASCHWWVQQMKHYIQTHVAQADALITLLTILLLAVEWSLQSEATDLSVTKLIRTSLLVVQHLGHAE